MDNEAERRKKSAGKQTNKQVRMKNEIEGKEKGKTILLRDG